MGRTVAAMLLMCWLCAVAGAVASAEDAKRDGPYIEKWPSDVHKIDAQYKDGDLEGPYLENFENGRIKIRANYSKGKRTGPYQEFFDNGKSHIVCGYVNGVLEGAYQEWTAEGKLKIQALYANGVLNGKYLEFDVDGRTLMKDQFYIYGRSDRFARDKKEITAALNKIEADTLKSAGLPTTAPGAPVPPAQTSGTKTGGGRGGRGGGEGGGGGLPAAGSLPSSSAVTEALIRLKQARMIAGVPFDDITLKDQYTTEAQAATDLLAQIDHLDHNPPQPPGMSDEKYKLALAGCQHGNLAEGSKSLSEAMMRWLYDSDDSNKDRVGHRRWSLNPSMKETGFGQNGKYYAIWAHDESRADVPAFSTIPWPASGYHPVAFFGPRWCWSVSLNPVKFAAPELKAIKVSIWALDKNYRKTGGPLELDHLVVNTEPYGVRYAVIFRPKSVAVSAGSAFLVEITGIKTSGGEDAPYTQVTEFF